MKKILFSAVSLDVGGIETALVTLLNYLASIKENEEYKYEITLVLEKKQGLFLDTIDKNINIIEYKPSTLKFSIIRKAINFYKQLQFKFNYKNAFDFSCAYATYSNPASFVARNASTNSSIWCHMDYLEQYNGDKEKVKEFFEEKHIKDFKHIIFVSKQGKETFLEVYPKLRDRTEHINNLIDYNRILKLSEEDIEEKDIFQRKNNEKIFINISRHDEEQKRLTRLINAAKRLDNEGLNFKIVLIGDGIDTERYKELVKNYKLTDKVIFLGRRKNPYPYLKMSDYAVLSSDYEGSPVIYIEAMVLNKPIITTNVSGSIQVIGRFGDVIEKDEKKLYSKMKEFIEEGYVIKKEFDPEEYNNEITSQIERII